MSDAPEATIETVTIVNLCLDDAFGGDSRAEIA